MRDRTRFTVDLRWFAPLIVAGVGALFGDLREPVQFVWPLDNKLYGPLLVQTVLSATYIIFEVFYATKRETTTKMLQADGLLATLWAIVATGVAVWLYRDGTLWWCVPIAVMTAWLDATISPLVALNNAEQKPVVSVNQARD